MYKLIIFFLLFNPLALACPNLEGRYPNCHSEIKKMKGEYQIDQYLENGIDVYSIKYIDEDGDIEQDDFKTDGTKSTRKKTIPTIGVQVRVDATAHCEANKLITKGKAYLLGKNVGTFNSITQKNEEGILVMQISAQYLNKNMEKLIQCAE